MDSQFALNYLKFEFKTKKNLDSKLIQNLGQD